MKIFINNFGPIKKLEFELKRLNILIGESGSGKSLLSKLIFLFLTFWEKVNPSLFRFQYVKAVNDAFIEIFNKAFNDAYKDFSVKFFYKEKEYIGIEFKDNNLKINISTMLKERLKVISKSNPADKIISELKKEFSIIDTYFFPSGRNFFIQLEKNIFPLLESGTQIDYFLLSFGKYFQKYKEEFSKLQKEDKLIARYLKKILKGEYKYLPKKNEERFYINGKNYIPVTQISSGQQETLPALIVLWGILRNKKDHFIIYEEPESHIFPEDQKNLIELLILALNQRENNRIIISTHSPYTLTVINNFIQAKNSAEKNPEFSLEIEKIIPKYLWIDFKDVNAIELNIKKKPKIILSKKNQLIDTNIIDEISNVIGEEYEKLLEIEFK